MKRIVITLGIIILGVFAITLFSTCKIDADLGDTNPPLTTYSVTYNVNSATGGTAPAAQTKTEGVDLTLATNSGNLVRTDYTFAGWNTAADGSGTDYYSGVTYTTNAALALFAKWGAYYNSVNIGTLIYVPKGSFQRDSISTNISVITTPYRMSEHEITRDQFSVIMGADPSDGTYSSGTGDPVQMVNWYHAISFCNKLSIAEGLTQVYSVTGVNFSSLAFDSIPTDSSDTWNAATANWSANGYRLPTEMEWMWAAMGAIDDYTKLFAGSNGSNAIGDYSVFGYYGSETGGTTTGRSNPVGSKFPNELGFYDMSGNVLEWNWDWYASYPAGTIYSNTSEGRGAASGARHVGRGGGWSGFASDCTVACRCRYDPDDRGGNIGFRVVLP